MEHHGDPVASLALYLAVILVTAKLGGHLASRVRQPAVLGELAAGIVLGNLSLAGLTWFEPMKTDMAVDMLARLGVVLLLFQVGLESTVAQMMKVGFSAVLVGTLGVIGPFAAGWGVGAWLVPEAGTYAHIFLGATLTATSVGITARVIKDLGRSGTDEARLILGAAVIDDVQGLIILAVVTGLLAAANQGTTLSYAGVGLVILKASGFLVGAILIGVRLSPSLFALASRLNAAGVLLAVGLAVCFLLAGLADRIGLAPIVGAFAAGLVLERVHFKTFTDRGDHELEVLIEPIASFLVPVFFVVMGLRTDLRAFVDPSTLGLAAAVTVAAIVSKPLCALGVVGRGLDRLSVALGMIPRGEVGLIFANLGMTLTVDGQPVVSQSLFSAIVVMVVVTTVVTPPALTWSFQRARLG